MGVSTGVSCKECLYSKEFLIGIGMMYSPEMLFDFRSERPLISNLIESKKVVEEIKNLVTEKSATIDDGYGHEIYHCSKCGEFYNRLFMRLNYEGGSYEVVHKCPKCKETLVLFDRNGSEEEGERDLFAKHPCPDCGKHSLYLDNTMRVLWD